MCQRTGRQTTLFFYKVETNQDRLLEPEVYVIPNFVKIVRTVLENVNIYMYTFLARLIVSEDNITCMNFKSFE